MKPAAVEGTRPFFGTIVIRTVGGREILRVREDQVVLHHDDSSFEGKAECTWWSLLLTAGIPRHFRRRIELRRMHGKECNDEQHQDVEWTRKAKYFAKETIEGENLPEEREDQGRGGFGPHSPELTVSWPRSREPRTDEYIMIVKKCIG